MRREIALMLLRTCRQQQGREYNAWHCARGHKQAEKHRLACADWATAAQEIYNSMIRQEKVEEAIAAAYRSETATAGV